MFFQANHPAAAKMTKRRKKPPASFTPIFIFFSKTLTSS
jgi:hypothetical protein